MKAYAKCRACEKFFVSPMQIDQASLKSSTLRGNTTTCPHCRQTTPIGLANMFYFDGPPPPQSS